MNPSQKLACKCQVFLCDYSDVIIKELSSPCHWSGPHYLCALNTSKRQSLPWRAQTVGVLQVVFPYYCSSWLGSSCRDMESTVSLALCRDALHLQEPAGCCAGARTTFCVLLEGCGRGLAEPLCSAACLLPPLATSWFGLLLNLVLFYIYFSIEEKELNDPSWRATLHWIQWAEMVWSTPNPISMCWNFWLSDGSGMKFTPWAAKIDFSFE